MAHVIAACRDDSIPHLRKTALFVLGNILNEYPLVISSPRFCANARLAVEQIISLIRFEESTHSGILRYFGFIVSVLGNAWRTSTDASRAAPPELFPTLFGLMKQMMQRPLVSEDAMRAYADNCEAINDLIMYGGDLMAVMDDHHTHADLLRTIFSNTVDDLERTRWVVQPDHIGYFVQARLCSNLTSLAFRLGLEIPEQEVHRAVDLIFTLLGPRDILIYEEGLMTLAVLCTPLHASFCREDISMMLELVQAGLESESPGVINSASILLSSLFHFNGADLADRFLLFLDTEEELLRGHAEMRVIHPFVVRALAEMFEGVGHSEDNREMLAPLGERLFALMQMVRSVPIDVARVDDIEYGNALFESLAKLYRVFARLYYPILGSTMGAPEYAREKEVLNEMAAFASAVLRLRPVNEDVLLEFIVMIRAFGERSTRKNLLVLNAIPVHRVLELAQETHQTSRLRRLGEDARLFIMCR
jgi:hypothetical protein